MSLKVLTVNGVPYLTNDKGEVFVYSSVPPIQIGNYENKVLTLFEDWQVRMESWVTYYRDGLKEQTTAALEKAAELQRAS